MIKIEPYGSWTSPLSAQLLAEKGVRYGHMTVDQESVYWLESRAAEKGRSVLIRSDFSGKQTEVLPKNISVRTKVHEYGCGDFLVSMGVVYFSNAKDQCVYRFDGELTQLTEHDEAVETRYADYALSPDKQTLVCVRERHLTTGVVNDLVCIPLTQGGRELTTASKIKVLHSGFDFYSSPRLSRQGHRLAWICWNQPDMPWDATELWVADFHSDGNIDAAHHVIGGNDPTSDLAKGYPGEDKVSVSQPVWSDDGVLHYISDSSGWSNIYSFREGVVNALAPIDREFGIPQWILASSTYAITEDNHIYAVYIQQGQQQLCHIDEATGHIEPLAMPFKYFGDHLLFANHCLYFRAAGPAVSEAIYQYNTKTKEMTQLSKPQQFPLPVEDLSIAEPIQFESTAAAACHAFYYRPHNSQFQAPETTAPPLIVMSHGGPTAMTNNSLNAAIQFWTHRGFAVVDVNYRGSTGFGKRYKDALIDSWGISDVDDCIAAAQYLVDKGLADPNALLIRGGSAGGYTTLSALTFHNVFAAGMSRYGVADLESLASDSHKFEARYLDSLVGAYPKEKARYVERSPINHTDQLSCPILLLQGEDDKVVPPNQAEMMVEALSSKKIPYAYQLYPGEAHGFRQASTIISALNSELYFYRQILNLADNEGLPEITINHWR
jgi:dipeptidyl aminopeptidase/acylaminoacyl peptidase